MENGEWILRNVEDKENVKEWIEALKWLTPGQSLG